MFLHKYILQIAQTINCCIAAVVIISNEWLIIILDVGWSAYDDVMTWTHYDGLFVGNHFV